MPLTKVPVFLPVLMCGRCLVHHRRREFRRIFFHLAFAECAILIVTVIYLLPDANVINEDLVGIISLAVNSFLFMLQM